tara:strand:- start:1009 stop:1434 length:426 start_codon:yes stop_codon:yes gene_type:complete
MKDLKNNISVVQCIAPVAGTSDATGTAVDLQGYESCTFVIDAGIEGITLSGTNKIEVELEESSDNSTWTDVSASTSVIGATPDSNGVVATFDADGEIPAVATVGYIGDKRYVRAIANFSGTHGTATPLSVSCIRGHARHNG